MIGAEADLDWANITGSGTVVPTIVGVAQPFIINLSSKTDGIGTARIRAGAASNNWLLYATAGVALLRETTNGTTVNGIPCGTLCVLTSRPARIGVQTGLSGSARNTPSPNWTLKANISTSRPSAPAAPRTALLCVNLKILKVELSCTALAAVGNDGGAGVT